MRSRQYLFGTVGRNKPARPTPDPKIISYGSKQQGGREAGSLLQGGTWDRGEALSHRGWKSQAVLVSKAMTAHPGLRSRSGGKKEKLMTKAVWRHKGRVRR